MLSLTGLLLGGLASVLGVGGMGWSLGTGVLVVLGCWALAFVLPLGLSELGGKAARTIHNPSGRSTPYRRGYSHAESLIARGLYLEAIDAFEVAIAENPSDPLPYLSIARLYREHMGRPADSAEWFKRALKGAAMQPGMAYLATRELVELYVTTLGDPIRAAPLLARMAEERAGTPEGSWAAEELARVKASSTDGDRQ